MKEDMLHGRLLQVCDDFGLWMHVDGAAGASFLLPPEAPYSTLCQGMNRADSISWNIHKLLGVPIQCSALLFRQKGVLTTAQEAVQQTADSFMGAGPQMNAMRSQGHFDTGSSTFQASGGR